MPCSNAMITDVVTVTPEMSVEEALVLFQEKGIRGAPVVDENGKFLGLLNFKYLLDKILPAPLAMQSEIRMLKSMNLSLDHLPGQSQWLAGRLQKLLDDPVKSVMKKDVSVVHPYTPLREAVRIMVLQGSPLPVVDDKTDELLGLISSQGAIKVLLQVKADLKRKQEG